MRLLHTKDLQVHEFAPGNAPEKYAILSHTWEEEGEVTLQDIEKGHAPAMKGYMKLKNSCRKAVNDGYHWIWIDACCIDKTSSAELSEAINSMFKYYSHSSVCYAYLADIENQESLEKSKWFTRGWTLQELLAPRVVIFFDSLWTELGTKQSFSQQISFTTGIPEEVVLSRSVQTCNVAQRMSWASQRQTTRDEDIAYCLLGLFDVHMTPIYGEGAENAFLRLQEEILRQSSDHTLFIWTPKHDPYNQGLLASSPKAFCTHPECFDWMSELRARQGPFEPYAHLRRVPNTTSKQFFTRDKRTGRTGFLPEEDQEHRTPASASLGQSGLQISLHSHVKDESELSLLLGTNTKVLLFDLLLIDTDARAPIQLALARDIDPDFAEGFAPNRLGAWRRHVHSEFFASYLKESVEMSFERVPVTISQIKTPVPYSGDPLAFGFRGQQSEELVSSVLLAEPEGCLKRISILRESFRGHGGIVVLNHSCTQCDPRYKVAFFFGGHDRIYRPWCCMGRTAALGEDDSPATDSYTLYESQKYQSARFGPTTSTYLPCKVLVSGQIDYGAEEDCYFIALTSVLQITYSVSAS
ncbi:hypothetical protein G647_03101 [Cladophialophora carrionii CBS 160.54]|uniref:Uncharacterized protein n=1 Tax=Cladophialophora carrionii CBS 160.54 TaxID=1279043 RepID=V9DHE8_9EURO|nr:uncharacterized protein G647_03101 [Cladophialophora carrionii CBS 160.54]ETI26324.1 hypothetical protein G647_03101 [Cladophialophora carrionii CBS 160.54]